MTDSNSVAPGGPERAPALDLTQRYGRMLPGSARSTAPSNAGDFWDEEHDTASRPRLTTGTRVAIGLGLTVGVVIAAWFTIVDTRSNPVTFTNVGFTVPSTEEVGVTFDVNMPPGSTAICTVTALNQKFAEVGAIDVEVGPTPERTTRRTVTIATTQLATTGIVDHCDLH